ncbi:hypothetical protein CKO28_05985 [Rhodovibrio sodomensis]|uniref:Glycosyl transferase family 1 domain-containing protein n=1 Tax=Rhodovibrio sodomensis TaxID=1088 RepID=A0ABS1DCD8_9PROT|nr:hypothetical protein [Rhodovibrio sodomensis]MBK1667581.1 hypothetical protein [Rhodovibrio sodomensis]
MSGGPDFDLIFVADLRFPGGTSTAIAHEIRAAHAAGYSVGLYQVNAPLFGSKPRPVHPHVQAEITRGRATEIPERATAEARLLVVHNPYILARAPRVRPNLRAERRVMVAHQPPADRQGRWYYDAWRIDAIAREAFGGAFVWAPISPACRDSFDRAGVDLPRLRENWLNLIFVDDWGAARLELRGNRPRIGRHSRAEWQKWPDTREQILTAYPETDAVDVRLLGVGDDLLGRIGRQPANWTTWRFNEIGVADFLSELDFFVYYHHSSWVEAFGRTIAEAAAAGCVCVLPPHFRRTFGDAAVYAELPHAQAVVATLASDPDAFRRQSAVGRAAIDRDFGPRVYQDRLARILEAPDLSCLSETPVMPGPVRMRAAVLRHLFPIQQRLDLLRRRARNFLGRHKRRVGRLVALWAEKKAARHS